MLGGFHVRVRLPQLRTSGSSRRLRSLFAFGVAYAIASLSCTLPVFLTVVSGTVTRSNSVSGLVAFVVYTLGMSLVLLVATLAVATARGALIRHLRRAVRYVGRLSGALLVLAGGYIAYYWGSNLAVDPATGASAPGARWGERLSRQVATWIDTVGATRLGILLGGLVAAAAVHAATLRLLTRGATQPTSQGLPPRHECREALPEHRPGDGPFPAAARRTESVTADD